MKKALKKTKTIPVKKAQKRKTEIVEEPKETLDEIKHHPFRYGGERCDLGFKELVNLAADTLERLGYFSDLPDEKDTRANCEAWGEIVVRAMMRGVSSDGGSTHSANQTRFTEHSFNHVPYCKQHK